MSEVIKLKRIHVRIDEDLKERFDAICAEKGLNGSALVRKWIEEFVEENEPPADVQMDVVGVVWALNTERETSIKVVCERVAERCKVHGVNGVLVTGKS